MSSSIQLEIHFEDQTPDKWCIPLTEDVFQNLMSRGSQTVHKVFRDGSMFSPLLFGKYFDPSDAFPLWEFESEILLSKFRSSNQSSVDWFQTDSEYVLKAELPGFLKNSVELYVENGKVMEISGLWRLQKEVKKKDWRSGNWWEYGCVRRVELPENADWRNLKAQVNNDVFLEIRIPKIGSDRDNSPLGDHENMNKDSEFV